MRLKFWDSEVLKGTRPHVGPVPAHSQNTPLLANKIANFLMVSLLLVSNTKFLIPFL